MKARERADKILNYINGEFGVNPSVTGDQSNLEFVAAAIEEAEREAVINAGVENFSLRESIEACIKHAKAEGYSAAREQAKGIISEWKLWTPAYVEMLIDKIDAMTPDGWGGGS